MPTYNWHVNTKDYCELKCSELSNFTNNMPLVLQDGHVEVARLLLDSGAQVNMPTDSFESPLTLAACGGHVELAQLLISREANLEEVNDEGYTAIMEAAREGHEEMVTLLLSKGMYFSLRFDQQVECFQHKL